MSRPTPHPAKAVIASRRITIKDLSERVGVNPHTLGRILNGYVDPWPALRTRLSQDLELPEVALFRGLESSDAA